MAEVLLRRHLTLAGVDATVSSAGLYEGGVPATAHGVAAMADRGLDLAGPPEPPARRARWCGRPTSIIGMAREHVREAAVLDGDVLPRTFTLKELARGAEEVGPRAADEPLGAWLRRIAAAREPGSLVGVGYHDDFDVEDPDRARPGRLRDDGRPARQPARSAWSRWRSPIGDRHQERSA